MLVVQIRQQQFDINREYREGDTLTAGEALALNQLLVERIRKGMAPRVARIVRHFGVLSSQQHSQLQQELNDYASQYEFNPKPGYRPEVPLERAVKEVAHQEAEKWGQQNGNAPDSLEVHRKYIELCNDSGVRDKARELIRLRLGVAQTLMQGAL